jgi:glycosyltransferase involved in cell wall biosynthesis
VAQIVSHLQPRVPCSVLPTGIDIARFASASAQQREQTRQRLSIAADEVVLLYVGRIVREKNLVFLLRSLEPLLNSEGNAPKMRLVLVGGGPDMEPMRNLAAQLNIGQKVIFTDFVAPSSTLDYYAAADTFVFASRTETQGVSIAEALAAGLPCVVVGAMGAAEAVTDGVDGFIVPPNEEQFRDAVQRLITSPELRQRMSKAAQRKAPQLSREHCVDELLQLYCNLVSTRE